MSSVPIKIGLKKFRFDKNTIPDVRLHHDRLAVLAPEPPRQDGDRNVVDALPTVDHRRRRRCRGRAVGAVQRRRGQVDLEGEAGLKKSKPNRLSNFPRFAL